MCMIDVQPGAVGEDHVGHTHVLVGQLGRVGIRTAHVETTGVTKRGLHVVVPAGALVAAGVRRTVVGGHHLAGHEHGVGVRMPGGGHPVLGFDTHDPLDAHHLRLTRCDGLGADAAIVLERLVSDVRRCLMADGQEHKQRTHDTQESEDVVGEQIDAASARKAEIDADVDSILDEIDDVLEENAEEFVASFVQKGGQ